MEPSFRICRVRGVPIGANWSWLVVFGLVVWSLATGLFPSTYPGLSGTTYVLMALAASTMFFASIVLHELGHTFRALAEGMRIRGITLWLFGGVAEFENRFPSAGAELRVAGAGPLVSAALAVVCTTAAVALRAASAPDGVVGVADYVGRINGLLLGFNLVPALPLDGGRMLHAWLWHRRRSSTAATVTAARAGRAFGLVLVWLGILGIVAGGEVDGIWFVLIGSFLMQAARAEAGFAVLEDAVGGLRVRDLMVEFPATDDLSSDERLATVDEALPVLEALPLIGHAPGRAVVTDAAGHPVGVLSADAILHAVEHDPRRSGTSRSG